MAKPIMGLMACPECGFPDSQIKEDKSGNAYRFCPECEAQYFTRGGEKDKKLRAAMRVQPIAHSGAPNAPESPINGTGNPVKHEPVPAPVKPAKTACCLPWEL